MKKIIIYLTLTFACGGAGKASEALLLVSGIPYHFDERTYEITQRPMVFAYNEPHGGLDTVLRLSPPKPFMNVEFIGLYNTFGLLVVLKSSPDNASRLLTIVDLNTLQQDSVKFEEGVSAESNLLVLSSDSIYYCVRSMETFKEIGVNKLMKLKDFAPHDYNYAYIQGQIGMPVDDREYLFLYNEKTNNNALHISKGYGLKVGPYLKLQPPKEMYNAYPPALKSIRINDFHSMIILYDYSKPDGNTIGEKYFLVYDKNTQEWYKQTIKGNASSIRSYDNGWVAGTIMDKDKGAYFDNTTMTYGDEYDFKRKVPGYDERVPIFYDRTDGVWGDCFDERVFNDGIYYPGLLYLFNVHTKDYIEWDTKQGDSEVLLVQDSTVYYRVNTKILKSAIVNSKRLGTPKLLIDDVRARDIHWAYISPVSPPLRKSVAFDRRHELLYNHVYRSNNSDVRDYQTQAQKIFDKSATLPLGYAAAEENEWVNSWKIGACSSLDIARNVVKKLQKAAAGETVGAMPLRKKVACVGTLYIDKIAYPVAVYSERDTVANLKKVQVSGVGELRSLPNRSHLRYDDSFERYIVLAFYDDGSAEPALTLQVEKAAERYRRSTLEEWLRFLNILQTP